MTQLLVLFSLFVFSFAYFQEKLHGDFSEFENFGSSIAMYQNYLISGTKAESKKDQAITSVFIFKKIEGKWNKIGKIESGELGDRFGDAIGITDQYIFVGATKVNVTSLTGHYYDHSCKTGVVYVYKKDSQKDEWKRSQILHPNLYSGYQNQTTKFGLSIAISKSDTGTLFVGEQLDDPMKMWESGSGSIYKLSNEGLWEFEYKFHADDPIPDTVFGESIDIFGDNLIMSGYRGNIIIGKYDDEKKEWTENFSFTLPESSYTSYLTPIVAISEKHAVVGSSHESNNQGGVYFFHLDSEANWKQLGGKVLFPGDARNDSYFGGEVALFENYAIISCVYEAYELQYGRGRVYVYKFDELSSSWNIFYSFYAKDLSSLLPQNQGFGANLVVTENDILVSTNNDPTGTYGESGKNNSLYIQTMCFSLIDKCKNGGNPNQDCTACTNCDLNCDPGMVGDEFCQTCICPASLSRIFGSCIDENLIIQGIIFVSIGFAVLVVISLLVICPILIFMCIRIQKYAKVKDLDIIIAEQELERKEKKSQAKIKLKDTLFQIKMEDIKIVEMIGQGGSGTQIFRAEWKGQNCAFKRFHFPRQKFSETLETEDFLLEFEKELSVCGNLSHPSIIQFYGASIDLPKIGLLIEYCSNGDIPSFFSIFQEKHKKKYAIEQKIRLLKEIVSGMDYLHSQSFIHRDLKPENVLINGEEKAKITDFGLSKLHQSQDQTMTSYVGTSYYMSPEVISSKVYSFPTDVYSFAVLAYVIITENFAPFGINANQTNIIRQVAKNPNFRPKIVEQDFKDCIFLIELIKKNWSHSPEDRNSFPELQELFRDKLN